MPIARHRSGPLVALRALGSQVKPRFMAPALAASVYGGLLAAASAGPPSDGLAAAVAGLSLSPAAVHLLATFLALYTAHVKDGLVDFYERGEDEALPLTREGCRVAIVGSGVGFAACALALWWLVGPLSALLTVPLWPLGYLHAPWLDRGPVGTSTDYAVGVALVVLGGNAVQAHHVSPVALGVAGVFIPVLAAGAVLLDVEDRDVDERVGKRTVPTVLGPRGATRLAAGLVALSAALVAGLVVVGVLPTAALVAAAVLALASLGPTRWSPDRAVTLLQVGTTVAAVLVLAAVVVT